MTHRKNLVRVLALAGLGIGFALAACSPGGPDSTAPRSSATPQSPEALRAEILEIVELESELEKARRLTTLIPTLDADDVPTIDALLHERFIVPGAMVHLLLVEFWAMHEPKDAARWTAGYAPKGYASAISSVALTRWAEKDPVEALGKLGIAGHAPLEKVAQKALVKGWFRSGEPGLPEWIKSLGMGPEQQRAMDIYTELRVKRDGPDALMDWGESLAEDDRLYLQMAYARIGGALATVDVDKAIEWCNRHCDGPYGGHTARFIAMNWAKRDGPAAADWLMTTSPGPDRENAVISLLQTWRHADFDSLDQWVEGLDRNNLPEAFKGSGLRLWPKFLAIHTKDYPRALGWAALLEEERKRHRVTAGVAKLWYQRDPEAAGAWIEASSLPEEKKAQARGEAPPDPDDD